MLLPAEASPFFCFPLIAAMLVQTNSALLIVLQDSYVVGDYAIVLLSLRFSL